VLVLARMPVGEDCQLLLLSDGTRRSRAFFSDHHSEPSDAKRLLDGSAWSSRDRASCICRDMEAANTHARGDSLVVATCACYDYS